MNITIRKYEDNDLESLNYLLMEAFNLVKKGRTIKNIELVAVSNGIVVGYLVINKLYDSIKDTNYAYLNYVCVLDKYQNNKIGTMLLEKTFDICREKSISYIELTSNNNRKYAHHLYEKEGFEVRDTNVFRKVIV